MAESKPHKSDAQKPKRGSRAAVPKIEIKYLVTRKRSHLYRRDIPADIVQLLPATIRKTVWKHPLPSDLADAIREAERLSKEYDEFIEYARHEGPLNPFAAAALNRMRVELEGDRTESARERVRDAVESARDDVFLRHGAAAIGASIPQATYLPLSTAFSGASIPANSYPVSAMYEMNKAKHAGTRNEEPFETGVRLFIEACGDVEFLNVTHANVEKFIAYCQRKGQSDPTIQRRLNALRSIQNDARIALDLPTSSAWKRHRLKKTRKLDSKQGFHTWHFKLIQDWLDGPRGSERVKLMVRLMRGTTMGIGEVLGLEANDVDLNSAIPTIFIRPNSIRDLKVGDDRARRIPLIGDALEAARLAVAKPASKQGLFIRDDYNPKSASATINKALREQAGLPHSKRLTSYCFRHAMLTAMRDAGVRPPIYSYAMGHAQNEIADVYSPSQPLMAELVEAFQKAELFRGKVSPSVFTFEELPAEHR